MKVYKTIIIKNKIDNVISELKKNSNLLDKDGSLFCIVKTQYSDNRVDKDFLDIIKEGIELDLKYINTIIIPDCLEHLDNIQYCVWFVKDLKKYYFNKDKIREKSIWKDVEWGKREKNYNSKGKDPGNVWIPTEDDGKAKITKHVLLSNIEVINRLLSATMISKDDKYLIIGDYSFQYNSDVYNGDIKNISSEYKDISFGEYIEDYNNTVINGNVIFGTSENMKDIDNNSVDLIVTSPPYWDLKDYYKENQIGQESYDVYSQRINKVWNQCYNKLKSVGSMWININIRVRNGAPILLPKLFVDQCKKIGFIYRGILVWHKSSGIPTNSKNLSDHHEYVLIFTKEKHSKIHISEFKKICDYKNDKISEKMIWNINRKAGSVGKNTIHPAIFPTELINRIIKISTNENDIVVDPFLGSGTSLIAALNNNRKFYGYEFNEKFKELMDERFCNEILINSQFINYIKK